MPQPKRKEKPMTLDRLARIVKFGFEKTDRQFAHMDHRFSEMDTRFSDLDGRVDKLAASAYQEFTAIRSEMATKAEVTVISEDLRILHTDVEEGFRSLTMTLKALLQEVKELRAMDAELTELRVRVKRLEKKVGITG